MVDKHQMFGPQDEQVEALIERISRLTKDEIDALSLFWNSVRLATGVLSAWGAAADAALNADRTAAYHAARKAAWNAAVDVASYDVTKVAAWSAAWDAAGALVVRDLISTEHYDVLTRPWRQAVGRIHPDDPELTA